MGLKKYDVDPADADADGLAAANTSAGATVTLDGVLTSGGTFTSADGLAHQIEITDAGAHVQTTATYTVTGTNSNGNALVEAITGPGSGATIITTGYFLTVTSIAIASPVAGSTVNIGTEATSGTFITPVYPLNWRCNTPATIAITGTVGTYVVDIQETFDDIYTDGVASATWFDKHADENADMSGVLTLHATAVRLQADSYTSGAELQFHINQLEYST